MNERGESRVTVLKVEWVSEEGPGQVEPTLNLVLCMYSRIFTYTSNILMVRFEQMD